MTTPSLKKLRFLLFRRGMSPGRINRITWELEQHLEDIREELSVKGRSPEEAWALAQERIGRPEALADEIVGRLNQRTWEGRHPALFSLLMPVLLLASWVLVEFTLVGSLALLVKLFRLSGGHPDFPLVKASLMDFFWLSKYTATTAAAWVLIQTARKCSMELKWVLAATAVTAVLGFTLFPVFQIHPPTIAGAMASGSFGLGLGLSFSHWPPADHLIRFVLPLLLFGMVYAVNIRNGFLRGGFKNEK